MTQAQVMSERLVFEIGGVRYRLQPGNHCWDLERLSIKKATGEEVVANTTYHANLGQVTRWVGEEIALQQPTLGAAVAAIGDLADAMRGLGNQLEQPANPWSM